MAEAPLSVATDKKGGILDSSELRALITASPLPFALADMRAPDHPLIAANDAFCALTGYSAEEAVGRNARFLQGPESEAEAKEAVRLAIAEVRPTIVIMTNYRKDGSSFRNGMMLSPVRDENGELAYYFGSQADLGSEPIAAAVLSQSYRDKAASRVADLSPRQTEVLSLLVRGHRNKEIASRLGLSVATVKMHRARLIKALGVRGTAEALRLAIEAGI